MIKTIVKRIKQRMSEFVLAVVIVIVCFALFLVILNLSFPEATSLRDLLRAGPDESASGSARATSGGAASNPLERPPDRALIARLGGIVRRVKDRSPTDVAWTNSADGTRLANGHAVQTIARSSASIVFVPRMFNCY